MRFAFRFNPSSLVLYRAGISCDGSLILIKTTQVKLNTWDGSALILPVLLFITYFLNYLSSHLFIFYCNIVPEPVYSGRLQ